MALGSDGGPDFLDFAGFADEEGTADDAHERAAHELFFPPGAEFLDGLVGGVAEEREIEMLFGLEGSLRFDGVSAHAEDGHIKLVKLPLCVAKLGRFNRSASGVGFGEEEEQDALASEVFECELFAFVG